MNSRIELLAEIEAFLSETGMSPTAYGKAVANDSNLVRQLRGGRSIGLKKVDDICMFMDRFREHRCEEPIKLTA